ncbi:MAG: hypothetical protein ACLRTQ_05760 [Candidatus Borkfalkia sp.]
MKRRLARILKTLSVALAVCFLFSLIGCPIDGASRSTLVLAWDFGVEKPV